MADPWGCTGYQSRCSHASTLCSLSPQGRGFPDHAHAVLALEGYNQWDANTKGNLKWIRGDSLYINEAGMWLGYFIYHKAYQAKPLSSLQVGY